MMGLTKKRAATPAAAIVTIEGEEARAQLPEGASGSLSLAELLDRLDPGLPDSRDAVLPDGVKCLLPLPRGCAVVHQTPPRVYAFRWIADESKSAYGPEATYRSVRLALPYLVVLAVFERARNGIPRLSDRNECFFSNQPLDRQGLDTPLCYPALLNCSRFPEAPQHPLSWICTQNLPPGEHARERTLGGSLRAGLRALLHHLLETGFNLSSEHHELNSWYTETVEAAVDARIASVDSWQKASAEDPLFVLDVPWLPTGHTLRSAVDRIAARGGRRRSASCADDLARVILNAPKRRSAE